MLATKRLAGVAPEINLRECVTHMPMPSLNKVTHSGFQAYRRRHQKFKTGISVAPPKKLHKKRDNFVFLKLFPKNNFADRSAEAHGQAWGTSRSLSILAQLAVCLPFCFTIYFWNFFPVADDLFVLRCCHMSLCHHIASGVWEICHVVQIVHINKIFNKQIHYFHMIICTVDLLIFLFSLPFVHCFFFPNIICIKILTRQQ